MLKEERLTSKDIFENPFEDINANVLAPEKIVEYWCSPFNNGLLTNFDEHMFRTSKVPIIIQGSRGSGKTTILKYFSYPAQLARADASKTKSFIKLIASERQVGFYYRCDDPFIETFKAIFKNENIEDWVVVFDHYMEMLFCRSILEMLFVLIERKEIFIDDETQFVESIIEQTIFDKKINATLNNLYSFICEQVNYINNYKNQSVFKKMSFCPPIITGLFEVSTKIVSALKKEFEDLQDVLFALMFDEFENLPIELQKKFNTLIKFSREDISLRIGRRSEGIVTNATINSMEYLRENHDYYLASLDKELDKDNSSVRDYFLEVAKKRFALLNNNFNNGFDIINMIGDKENLDLECKEICKGRKLHLEYILRENPAFENDSIMLGKIIELIRNDENPIAETLNALWVIREKKEYEKAAVKVAQIMHSYFNKDGLCDTKKYANDYTNKYRYAITVYICSVYKKPKLYYGFNCVCYLSNGNTRTFINLCRTIVSDALFYERKNFMESGTISKETQSRAIHNYSQSEFDEVCAIIKYGQYIRNLLLNIGNVFSAYHRDKRIRYPETNQFVYDELVLNTEDKDILNMAKSWAMIIKKEKTQRVTANVDKKGDIYHINKIFYPIFNISYRTRGGVNHKFTKEDIHQMIIEMDYSEILIEKIDNSARIKRKKIQDNGQLSLFELIEEDADEE